MAETRKLAAILAADVVGFSRLAGADEDRTLARLRALRSDLIDPTIAVHNGRVFKRTGDGVLVEFRSVVDAVRCAIEVQHAMVERNAGVPNDRHMEFRIGIHLGDVVEESDGDLMGDGVNIAARLEGICQARRDMSLRGRLSAGEGTARSRRDRSRVDAAEEHCRAGAGLFAASLRAGGEAGSAAWEDRAEEAAGPHRPRAGVLIALAAVVWRYLDTDRGAPEFGKITLAAVAWLHRDTDRGAPQFAKVDHERSIVVLPLSNLSGDPTQDSLADALTDELTTSIAGLPGMFVTARQLRLHLQGKADRREGDR